MDVSRYTPEQADAYWREMGEPPSSRLYLRTIYFDGEEITVAAPCPPKESKPMRPNEMTGDGS